MPDKLKVLHIIHTLENGGAEKLLLSTARKLKSLLQVEICSMYGKDELAQVFETEKIKLYLLNRKNKYNPLIILQLYKLIKKTKPDIVHTHLFFATVYGRIAARLCSIPNITTEHNASNWEKGPLLKIAYKMTVRYCARIIAISEAVKKALVEKGGISAAKVRVLHNCVQAAEFAESKALSEKKKNEFVVGSVGRLDTRKGFDVLLEAISNIKKTNGSIKCLLVGDGKENANLKKMASRTGINHTVDFAGSQSDILPFLNQMDVFVLPSRTEGFGLAILEAMAAGCPVIASNTGGIPEIVEHEVNGLLVPVEDSQALASAIVRMKDRDFANTLAANAKKTIATKFSMDAYIKKLLQEYNNLLSSEQ